MDGHPDKRGAVPRAQPAERRTAHRRSADPAIIEALRNERGMRIATLHGVVRALKQVLAVVDPIDYTRALRVQVLALDLAEAHALGRPWELESAAVLAPLGGMSLAGEMQQRAQSFDVMEVDDQGVLASLPRLTDRLLAPVPGLEEVRCLILLRHRQPLPTEWSEGFGVARLAELRLLAAVLRVADEFDALLSRGLRRAEALGWLRNESLPGESLLVDRLAGLQAGQDARVEVRSLPLSRLRAGMVIAEAVYTTAGQLLVNRDFEITEPFLERLLNFRRGMVREPVQVILPAADAPGGVGKPTNRAHSAGEQNL